MPGVKPVVTDSGSTTSSAPVASTHRSTHSTALARLPLTDSGVSGPGSGAIWIAAAVNALIAPSSGRAQAICRAQSLTSAGMAGSLSGQVAIVAGSTRGAGRAIAVELGAAGATVY